MTWRSKNIDPERREVFSRRAVLMNGGVGVLLLAISGRLWQLQILEHEKYRALAEENQYNRRLLPPLRGEIVDRFGASIATNRQNFRVLLAPDAQRDIEATLKRLGPYFTLPDGRRARILREVRRSGGLNPVEVADNLTWDQFSRLNFDLPGLPGVMPEVGATRHYPLGNAAAFVVGYVGAVNERDLAAAADEEERLLLRQPSFKVGRDGLERTYERELRGLVGETKVRVNAHGRVIEEVQGAAKPPAQGQTISLTIDAELQLAAMRELQGESASAVVIDIKTGDILVLASTPAFDPNRFNTGIPQDLWDELNASPYKPLLNKPLGGVYPPGSTFKMVSAIAAQRAGMKPSMTVRCGGKFWYGNRFFHCWKREGHGAVDMKGSLKHSCDTFYYTVATQLDVDLLADTARKLGLGQSYDLGVPGERAGVVPDREWKKNYYAGSPENQTWFPGETLSVIIGQGSVTSTPLQLAVMAARIASGREVRPRIVRMVGQVVSRDPEFGVIDIDPGHFEVARAGMDAVTNEPGGTAYRSRLENPDWRLAGKTGTSQVYAITKEERARGLTKPEQLPWHRRDHALFVCYAPVQAPRYACAVVVEHGIGGARAAGPKAREIMRAVMTKNPAALPPIGPEAVVARRDDAERAG